MISTLGLLMSLNDPQWGNQGNNSQGNNNGRKPDQGPPDLEELWRDFNRRLAGLFGGKGGGKPNSPNNPGSGPDFSPRFLGSSVGLILVLLVLAWLASGFYIVDASQRGVVLRFGKFQEVTEPGLRWRLPYPIESHEVVNLTGVRTVEVGYRGSEKNKVLNESLMLTDDENIINIQFAVQYYLKDPVDYLFNNRHADETVMQAAETAIREVVGKSQMDYVLYEGREQVASHAAKLMQDILDRYKTGIVISKVTMQNAQPPEQVQAAFDDAVKAGQDRERQKNEGQAYANDVIPKARGTAARLTQEAQGYRQRIIATAEGDAARFKQILPEYAKAPQVTRERMYLETMQQVLSNTSKVMVDAKGQGKLLYLPLDKLMQAAGAPNANNGANAAPGTEANARSTTSPAGGNGAAPVGRSDDQHSREGLRSRDRDGR